MPSDDLKTTLNPCRRCGSDAVRHEQFALPGTGSHAEFIVTCSTCIQRGEWKPTEFEAVLDWNTKNK